MGEGWTDVVYGETDPLVGILEGIAVDLGRIATALERTAASNRPGFAPVGKWDEQENAGCDYFDPEEDAREEEAKLRQRERGY